MQNGWLTDLTERWKREDAAAMTPTEQHTLPWRIEKAIDRFSDAALNWERHGVDGFPAYERALATLRQEIDRDRRQQYASGYAEGDMQANLTKEKP